MISAIISRLVILVFGTLYPAYASYKAVRTKNLKEYVKWMMYWIVFALFTCTETFTDVFLSWFPFYYEVKIVLVLWLLSPATKGSSILYRKFVHPALCRREQEIDEYIAKAKDQGYHTVLNLGTKGVNYATTVIMQTAIKGGGGLVQQLRKSYSLSDLTECEPREERGADEADDVMTEPRLIKRAAKSGFSTRRSASESNSRSPMYFPEVDVDVRSTRSSRSDEPDFSHIKSSEDISSGYSSADNSGALSRTGSVGGRGRRPATRTTTIKRPQAAEESEVIIEEPHDDDIFEYANMPPLFNIPSPLYLSHSDPPFLYQYIGDQIKIVQVLGNLPLNTNANNKTNDFRQRDEKQNINDDIESNESLKAKIRRNVAEMIMELSNDNDGVKVTEVPVETGEKDVNKTLDSENINPPNSESLDVPCIKSIEKECVIDCKTELNTASPNIDTSHNDDSAESDDEASFGTPENSPKSKRKSPRGKYGKAKAPLPPPNVYLPDDDKELSDKIIECAISTTSQESLTDIVNKLPNNAFKDVTTNHGLQVVNPIAEKKRRHKSKSPSRIPKAHSSGIGKLLHLPGKLAFWQKTDDKPKSDTISTSSGERSRRSSANIERQIDEFQSCSELDKLVNITDDSDSFQTENNNDTLSFKDIADFENEIISQDIIEKSDALQKLITAKIESHPEYKYVSLHEEIPTTSKSTDV
ncbi:uncharacterized protein LOC131845033 [Achroia grisella]|uniref:uncharacterized protein LOC131845033 n=1 Tax=Achroia grisella TaxID=688607 RepID=UPI0027D2739A|nr:uncharacterized protein LOC131845033 [Achroia grisella]